MILNIDSMGGETGRRKRVQDGYMTAHSHSTQQKCPMQGGKGCRTGAWLHTLTALTEVENWRRKLVSWCTLMSHHPCRVTSEQDRKEGKDVGPVHELTR